MRNNWNVYFMEIAELVSSRSTCLKRKVGAVAVRDKRIVATGYNGSPSGLSHCENVGCLRKGVPSGENHEICRAVHAEQNVICQAAQFGISLSDAQLYIFGGTPCNICAKMLINVGIQKIICDSFYPDENAMQFLREAKIPIQILSYK